LPRRSKDLSDSRSGAAPWEDTMAANRRGELDDASTVSVISQEYPRSANLDRTSDPSW